MNNLHIEYTNHRSNYDSDGNIKCDTHNGRIVAGHQLSQNLAARPEQHNELPERQGEQRVNYWESDGRSDELLSPPPQTQEKLTNIGRPFGMIFVCSF